MTSEQMPERVSVGNRLLVFVEDVIYVSIAALLAGSALVVLVRTALVAAERARSDADDAMIDVLDSLLLVFIFVELLYAVRSTLAERQIVAEPFLIAGILTAIKEIIVLSVKAANEYLGKGPEFARAITEIAVLGALVAVLSLAAVFLRRKEKEPEENSGDDAEDRSARQGRKA